MFTIDKYNYNLQTRYNTTEDFVDSIKGIKLGGISSSQPYTLLFNYNLSEIPITTTTIQCKIIGVEGGSSATHDLVSTRTLIPTTSESTLSIDSSGIITVPLSSYFGKSYTLHFVDTYAAESTTFNVIVTLNFIPGPFTSYTYSGYYKVYDAAPTDAAAIPDSDLTKMFESISFSKINNFSYYNGISQSSYFNFADQSVKGKYLLFRIKRNAIKNGDTILLEEAVLHNQVNRMYQTQYMHTYLFTDTSYDNASTYKLLFAFTQEVDVEDSPLHFYIDRIEWSNTPSSNQSVDLLVTDGDTSKTNTNGTIETIGNTLLYVENVIVNVDGFFLDSTDTSKKKKFFLNCTYDETGTLISGTEWDYSLTEKLSEDSKYNIYVLNHATDETYSSSSYTAKHLKVGTNYVQHNVLFAGQIPTINLTSSLSANTSPASSDATWYGELGNTPKVIGPRGGGSVAYYTDAYTNPIGDIVTDYRWESKASSDKETESYVATHIGKKSGTDTSYLVSLPNNNFHANWDLNGISNNCWPIDIFGDYDYGETQNVSGGYDTDDANTVRTLFFKFYLATGSTSATIIDILGTPLGVTTGSYSEFKLGVDIPNNKITIDSSLLLENGATETHSTPVTLVNQTLKNNKWYNLLMVVQHGVIKYINITDYSNFSTGAITVGNGISYKPGLAEHTDAKRISVDKAACTMSVTYTCTSSNYSGSNDTTGDDELAIIPCCSVYKYAEDDDLITQDMLFSADKVSITHNNSSTTATVTFAPGGYSMIPGIKMVNLKGYSSIARTITITSISFTGSDSTHTYTTDWTFNSVDNGMTDLFGTDIVDADVFGFFSVLQIGTPGNPIGGDWLIPTVQSYSKLVDTTISKDNFTDSFKQIYNRIYIGNINGSTDNLYVCKVGYTKAVLTSAIDISDPYKFISSNMMNLLGKGYEKDPYVQITYTDDTIVTLTKTDFAELKDQEIHVYLPLTLKSGTAVVKVIADSTEYFSKEYSIQRVQPDDNTIDFTIDFTSDFDTAVTETKNLFWYRHGGRGADLSGGENGNNVYFDRGKKAMVFENHGDLYSGHIPCIAKDGTDSNMFGGIKPLCNTYCNVDSEGNIEFYDSTKTIDPTIQRVERVGALIQSKKYYGYGEFEMDMKIEKGTYGVAVCWWMFHYQEYYQDSYGDSRYLKQYIGGIDTDAVNGDNLSLINFYIGKNKSKWNHLYSNYSNYGSKYIIANNEIDMEIGSEMCNIGDSTNPNSNSSLILYLPTIDSKTVYNCTATGSDYGMWMVDWDNSQTALNARWAQLEATADSNNMVDARTSDYVGIPCNSLTWVHISNFTTSGSDFSTHGPYAIRFNNWFTQEDISSEIVKVSSSALVNSVRLLNSNTEIHDGTTGWNMNTNVASQTLRTPIGTYDLTNTDYTKRYIPHRLDDNTYHHYKFTWDNKGTKIYIDSVLTKTNNADSPYIPMPFVIGDWFPSFNSYDTTVASTKCFGGWAGLKAQWDVQRTYIKDMSYKHYTEVEAPRDEMLYNSETMPCDSLRQMIDDSDSTTATLTISSTPSDAVITINGTVQNSITVTKGTSVTWSVTKTGYTTQSGTETISTNTTKVITLVITTHTFSITSTPSDATITINGTVQSSVTIDYGSSVTWSVVKTGYITQSNTQTITSDTSLSINLISEEAPKYTLIVSPTPTDATVTLNGTVQSSINIAEGSIVNWSVSKTGYVTQSGTETVTADKTLTITLVEQTYTFTITATPSSATIILNSVVRSSISVTTGTVVSWSVSNSGYATQTGTETITADKTNTVTLIATDGDTLSDEYTRVDNKLASLVSEQGASNLVMWSMFTDPHISDSSAVSPHYDVTSLLQAQLTELKTLASKYSFSCMCFGGDIVGYGSNNYTQDTVITDLSSVPSTNATTLTNIDNEISIFTNSLSSTTIPILYTSGNHDTEGGGVAFGTYVPINHMYEKWVSPFASRLTYTDSTDGSTCCYYDDTVNKIRFASIDNYYDTCTAKWNSATTTKRDTFGATVFNTLPTDYKVVLLQHNSMGPNYYGSNASKQLVSYVDNTNYYCVYNKYEDYYDNLKALTNFDKLLLVMHGHYHIDNQSLTADNKFIICTQSAAIDTKDVFNGRNDGYDIKNTVEHLSGYATESAYDIYVYNKVTGQLNIVRCGAGHDRKFELTATTPKMYYNRVRGSLSSTSITDFTGVRVLLTSRMDNTYDKNNTAKYKTNIFINVNPNGTFDSYASYVSSSATTKLGIPPNISAKVKILSSANILLKDTGTVLNITEDSDINLGTITI